MFLDEEESDHPTESSVYSNLSGQDLSHCSSIFTTARSSQLSSRCSTVRTSTHSSSTVLSSQALDPVFSGLGSLYSYPGSSLSSSVLVAAEGKCHDRVSPGISSSQSDPIHRRFPSGMGSLSGGSNCFRDVVFHSSERSHQSFGNEGSSVSSFPFQTLSGVPIYCLGNRQHNSGSLPEESVRNTLLLSVSVVQGCSDHMLSNPDIPGRLNVLADSLSRSLAPVNTEWKLHQAVFQSIVLHWGNPNIDLFKYHNSKLYFVLVFKCLYTDYQDQVYKLVHVVNYTLFWYLNVYTQTIRTTPTS